MKLPTQPRAFTLTRCTAALALASFSLATFAQTPPAQSPDKASSQPASSSAEKKPVSETLSTRQRQDAEDAYLSGARLLDRKDFAGAEEQFTKAAKLNPGNHDYAQAAALAHQERVTDLLQQAGKARLLGQQEKADALLAQARQLDPENSMVQERLGESALARVFRPAIEPGIEPWIRSGPALAGPIELRPNTSLQSFQLHSDAQDVASKVFQSYGIRATFDDSVTHEDLRFVLDNVAYVQAMPILLQMMHAFAVPLDPATVLIAKDTPDKRQRYERQLEETIYVPGMSNEAMDSLGNVIRQVFAVKQLTVEKNSGNLVLRAPEDTLKAVNLTLSDLIDDTSTVMIDLRLYAVDTTRQRNIGGQTPQQIGIFSVASEAQQIVNQNRELVNQAIAQGLVPANASNVTIALALIASGLVQSTLVSNTIGLFGGGLTTMGVTENQGASFRLALNSSDTRGLDDIQVRVNDRETATFRIGNRYPITTASYTNGIAGAASALAGVNVNGVPASKLLAQLGTQVTIPEIQYEDLGLTLKAVPTVQKSGNIAMQLDLKIESLAGSSSNNIPVLNSRAFVSTVTVPDGQTAMLVSTLTRSESTAISGLPGLGELPGFQTATADKAAEKDTSELILLVTPHVVRKRRDILASPRIPINLPADSD